MSEQLGFLEKVVCSLANFLEAYTVAYFEYNPRTDTFNCLASYSLSKYFQKEASFKPTDNRLLYQSFTYDRPVEGGKEEAKIIMPFYSKKEELIKAFFIMPVGNKEGILYVDIKHKWNFGRKELMLIKDTAEVIRGLISQIEKNILYETYSEILRFFYEIDIIIENINLEYTKALRTILEKMVDFLGVSFSFLVKKYPSDDSITLVSYFSPGKTLNFPSKLRLKGGLIEYVLNKKNMTVVPKFSGKKSIGHYLFFPGESLPKEGSFLGFYGTTCQSEWVLAFLSEERTFWDPDRIYGISRSFKSLLKSLDRLKLQKECEHLLKYDCFTGTLQARAFEDYVLSSLKNAVMNNKNLVFLLIQWEPYLRVCTTLTPSSISNMNYKIINALQKEFLGGNATIGQIGENRLGILLEDITSFDVKKCEFFLNKLDLGKDLGYSINFYSGLARYPQEASNASELWKVAYTSLLNRLESSFISPSSYYDESAIDILVRSDRTRRA